MRDAGVASAYIPRLVYIVWLTQVRNRRISSPGYRSALVMRSNMCADALPEHFVSNVLAYRPVPYAKGLTYAFPLITSFS